jgi:hypothetical protein
MPTNHAGNTANGNQLNGIANTNGFVLSGRLTNLPIYEIRYYDFANSALSGANFDTIVKSMNRDNLRDAQNGYRQPTDHGDLLGNLPLAPGGKIVYREYFLPGNAFTWTGFPRLIADPGSKRLFITPTHYDVWVQNPMVAAGMPVAALMPPATANARNPFFLITGAGAVNDMFR